MNCGSLFHFVHYEQEILAMLITLAVAILFAFHSTGSSNNNNTSIYNAPITKSKNAKIKLKKLKVR